MHPDLYRLLPDTPTPHRIEPAQPSECVLLFCARCGGAPGMLTLLDNCPVQRLCIREKALVRKLRCLDGPVTVADYNAEVRRLNDRMLDAYLAQSR